MDNYIEEKFGEPRIVPNYLLATFQHLSPVQQKVEAMCCGSWEETACTLKNSRTFFKINLNLFGKVIFNWIYHFIPAILIFSYTLYFANIQFRHHERRQDFSGRNTWKFFKEIIKKLRKSISLAIFRRFHKPCIYFFGVWTKNIICWKLWESFRKFSKNIWRNLWNMNYLSIFFKRFNTMR